jgi:hypothetical protein
VNGALLWVRSRAGLGPGRSRYCTEHPEHPPPCVPRVPRGSTHFGVLTYRRMRIVSHIGALGGTHALRTRSPYMPLCITMVIYTVPRGLLLRVWLVQLRRPRRRRMRRRRSHRRRPRRRPPVRPSVTLRPRVYVTYVCIVIWVDTPFSISLYMYRSLYLAICPCLHVFVYV